MKLNLDNISINTVMVFGAVIGVIYLLNQAKNAVKNVSGAIDDAQNWWKIADLNPFDSYNPDADKRAALYAAAKKALAKHGVNIDKYTLYQGKGGKLPSNSWKVTFEGKTYYYIPKYQNEYYSPDAGAGSFG